MAKTIQDLEIQYWGYVDINQGKLPNIIIVNPITYLELATDFMFTVSNSIDPKNLKYRGLRVIKSVDIEINEIEVY